MKLKYQELYRNQNNEGRMKTTCFPVFSHVILIEYLFYFSQRVRDIRISVEESDYRDVLQKEWSRYQSFQKRELHGICLQLIKSQNLALKELRTESETLYQAAIQPDETLLPISIKGPVLTPPIKNYDIPAECRFKITFLFSHKFIGFFFCSAEIHRIV